MLKIHISQEGKKKKPDGVFKTAINGTPSGFIQIIPINVSCNNTPLLTLIIQTGICFIKIILKISGCGNHTCSTGKRPSRQNRT